MTEYTEDIQEYIEELDAIIEEYNALDPEEKEDSADFNNELLSLRKQYDNFESLSQEEQDQLIQSTEALFFSISLFSDLEDDDLEDLTDWDELDEEDYTEEFDEQDLDQATLEQLSKILSQFTNTMDQENAEEAQEMKDKVLSLLANLNEEEKTIPISEA